MSKTIDLPNIENREVLANQVIENPVFKQAFLALECRIVDAFGKTKFKQTEERDELWRQKQTLDRFKEELESAMKSAKLKESNSVNKRFF